MAWNPFDDMDALRREVDKAFDQFGPGVGPSRFAFLPARGPRQYPLINLSEDNDAFYVEALAPGVDPGTLNLAVVRNNLTISGEKPHAPQGVRPEAFHRNERASGKFIRSVELPVEIEEKAVNAEYKNGLLLIRLPKAAKVKPKQINVTIA